MNETRRMRLRDFMESPEGWGREQGRLVHQRLVDFVRENAGVAVFPIALDGITRIDISFASETVVELARRYRGEKGFCLTNVPTPDHAENWDAAAQRATQPLMLWEGSKARILGVQPSESLKGPFQFALSRKGVRAAEYVKEHPDVSIANASTKFKQLWERGFLLRREEGAESGGVEFSYWGVR